MATATYTAIASITLGSSASSVEFSSIPQDYRDLVLVVSGSGSSNANVKLQFNADTGTNYSYVRAVGTGSTTVSDSSSGDTSTDRLGRISTSESTVIFQIMDYSATDKHTTLLSRSNPNGEGVHMAASRYASTTAITEIKAFPSAGSFNTGMTLDLYGIAS